MSDLTIVAESVINSIPKPTGMTWNIVIRERKVRAIPKKNVELTDTFLYIIRPKSINEGLESGEWSGLLFVLRAHETEFEY